jgi:choice-of-anchor C domain-containing protein
MFSKNSMTSCAAAALMLVLASGAQAANVVADGTFAEGSGAGSYTSYSGGATIGAWTVTGDSVDLIGSYWQQAPGGSYTVDLAGGNAGGISQGVHLDAGTYTLSFYLAGNPDGGSVTKGVDVSVGGASQSFSFLTTGHTETSMGFTLETLTFNVASDIDTTLSFVNAETGTPYGATVGGISLTSVVPEPGSMALLLAGISVLGLVATRRRNSL